MPGRHQVWQGAEAWLEVDRHARDGGQRAPLVVVDTYPGVDLVELVAVIARSPAGLRSDQRGGRGGEADPGDRCPDRHQPDRRPGLGGDQPSPRCASSTTRTGWPASPTVSSMRTPRRCWSGGAPPWCRSLRLGPGRTLVLADLARWEIQQRQRRGAPNWRCDNGDEDNLRKVKRGYFVEWRVADRHKRELFGSMDFVLDTNAGAGREADHRRHLPRRHGGRRSARRSAWSPSSIPGPGVASG